ncbi:hypothetical protein [Nocardia salmonicida]|uniref:hypothetical protein n=1 Tax=Nocardia salmonicida TaxID=53431 RepID=UPI00362E6F6F
MAGLTADLGGIGLRPEHAPEFARRPPSVVERDALIRLPLHDTALAYDTGAP